MEGPAVAFGCEGVNFMSALLGRGREPEKWSGLVSNLVSDGNSPLSSTGLDCSALTQTSGDSDLASAGQSATAK